MTSDGSPMEVRGNFAGATCGRRVKAMEEKASRQKRHPRTPAGCEGHLTRRQAAQALGFSSEFKIREFERRGVLHSVRGPMRAAFYPRAEILALKAQLALGEPGRVQPESWSDAELLALLHHPKRDGQARTALDLIMETQISIERAERVYDFWKRSEPSPRSTVASIAKSAPTAAVIAASEPSSPQERRGSQRLSRDSLLRNLRHPDPRIREQAFAQLKQIDSP